MVLYVFYYSSLLCSLEKFLQPVWRRQVPNSFASLTSFAGYSSSPMVLVMSTCFDLEFCFSMLIWMFLPRCVLLRTDLAWFFLGGYDVEVHFVVKNWVQNIFFGGLFGSLQL